MSLHSIDHGLVGSGFHNIEYGFGRRSSFNPTSLASLDLWLNADHNIYGGGARQFTAANLEYLSIADNADVSVGDIDFTWAGWMYYNSLTTFRTMVAKGDGISAATNEYVIDTNWGDANKIRLYVSDGTNIAAVNGPSVVTSGWYFVVAWHDATANTINIQLNNGTPVVAAHSTGVQNSTQPLHLGRQGTVYHDGRISRVFMWKRTLTTLEKTWLYNNGNGRLSGEMGVAGTDGANLLTNRVLAYNLNEPSGNAIDSQGNNDLTDNNTVTAADGPGTDIASDFVGSDHGVLNGFPAGGTGWSSNKPTVLSTDGSLVFDGVNDFVLAGTGTPITSGSVTLSFWIKSTGVGQNRVLLSRRIATSGVSDFVNYGISTTNVAGYKFSFFYTAAADTYHAWEPTSTVAALGVNDGAWHLITVRHTYGTPANFKFYVDGVSVAGSWTVGNGTAVHTNSASERITIGATWFSTGGGNFAIGNFADVRIYNALLSDAQVAELLAGSETTGATPLSHWKLDDGPQTGLVDGDPIIDWRAYAGTHIEKQHLQATYAKRPLFRLAGINSKAAVDFDGTDDLLVNPTAYLTGTQGHVFVVYRLDAVPDSYQELLGSQDEAVVNRYLTLNGRGNTANAHLNYSQANADTGDLLDGSTTINVSTNYIAEWASDGATISAKVNGAVETLNADSGANNGDWWDDVANKDNVTVGGAKTTSEGAFLNGKIRHILIFNQKLSDADALLVRQYLADDAGITL